MATVGNEAESCLQQFGEALQNFAGKGADISPAEIITFRGAWEGAGFMNPDMIAGLGDPYRLWVQCFNTLLDRFVTVYVGAMSQINHWKGLLEVERKKAEKEVGLANRRVVEAETRAAQLSRPQWQGQLKDYSIKPFTPQLELNRPFRDWARDIRALRSQFMVVDSLFNRDIVSMIRHPAVTLGEERLISMSTDELLTDVETQLAEFHESSATIAMKLKKEQTPLEKNATMANSDYEAVLSAVEKGGESAKTKLAFYKLSGYGGARKDVDEAVILLEERVKDRDREAMWMLGLCKEYGIGTEQDIEASKNLYKQSSEAGNEIGKILVSNWFHGSLSRRLMINGL